MTNPYEVLGVSETATDDEIKSAYRKLAKKYHPDNYANSPLADVAEQKMKEINEAYDTINQWRQKGKGSGSTGSSSYASGGAANSQFYNIRIYIQRNMIDQAEQMLDSIPFSGRSAEWHYLKGMCAYRRGWSEQAFSYFTTACNMNPNNTEYRAEDFKIGHTYFMVKNDGDLANRLRYQVLPILREYAIDGIIQKNDNAFKDNKFFDDTIRKYLYEGMPIPSDDDNVADSCGNICVAVLCGNFAFSRFD